MGVTDDITRGVYLLGSRVVVRLSVDEVTGLEVANCHLDCERRICFDRVKVLRELEFRGRHIRRCRDYTHRGWITGSSFDLLTIGERLVDGETEVDKVVC